MSLRATKKARTRAALAETGLRLFTEVGFDGVTMDRIAASSGVSRSTAFRYFPTKEALFFHRQAQRLSELESILQAELTAGADGWIAARGALLAMAERYQAEASLIAAQERIVQGSRSLQAADLQMDRAWERALADALAGDVAQTHPDRVTAEIQAGAIVGAVRATLRRWIDGGCREDLPALGRRTLDLLAAGFGGPGGHP